MILGNLLGTAPIRFGGAREVTKVFAGRAGRSGER